MVTIGGTFKEVKVSKKINMMISKTKWWTNTFKQRNKKYTEANTTVKQNNSFLQRRSLHEKKSKCNQYNDKCSKDQETFDNHEGLMVTMELSS